MTLAIQAALAIGRKYWGHISAALAVLFLILGIRGCGREAGLRRELAACLAKPPSVQYQTVTVTAKATQSVKIVYRDGSPCPDVEAVNTAEGGATVAQGQENGSKGQLDGKNRGLFSFSAGAGIYQGGVYPALGGGVWTETGLGSMGMEVLTLWPMAWEESQSTRRPVGVVSLTVRP